MDSIKQLLAGARLAANQFQSFDTSSVEAIVTAVAYAAAEKAAYYAKWAVEETGYGDVESKTKKNQLVTSGIAASLVVSDYTEARVDEQRKLIKFPKPAGVIVGLVPCTNPVATVFFKVINALATRNAIIICPHPSSRNCSVDAARFTREVAERAGAPRGVVQVLEHPSLEAVHSLMKSEETDLVLATGGPAMVRAAYSSGTPSVGVGAGNPPCYVDETANVKRAAACIIESAGFDNGLACPSESVILVHRKVAQEFMRQLRLAGGHIVENDQEVAKLRDFLFPNGTLGREGIGKSAKHICARAGLQYDGQAKVLFARFDTPSINDPLMYEKLFPCLGLMVVDDVETALQVAHTMLSISGKGHSAVVHADDPTVVMRFGNELPVCRMAINAPGVTGSGGFVTSLASSIVIGTGYFGGSSVSENVGPDHFVQWTTVAYDRDSHFPMRMPDAVDSWNSDAPTSLRNPSGFASRSMLRRAQTLV